MHQSRINRLRIVAIALGTLAYVTALTSNAQQQPNIVLLIADDLGYGELGTEIANRVPTPQLDALAQSGIRCTQAYVTAPNCSPSRAGLFTGVSPTRFGYEFNPIGARNEDPGTGLPLSQATLAELLRLQGYTTGLIGKWHLGGSADYHPLRHGFDEFFGFLHEGHFYQPSPYAGLTSMLRRRSLPQGVSNRLFSGSTIFSSHMGHDEPAYDANNPILHGGQPVVEPTYLTQAFTREAISFIDRHQDKPFFLTVAYNAVHSPLQARTKVLEQFKNIDDVQRQIFSAMLSDLDTSIGEIVESLDGKQMRNNTVIFFISDNGGPTRELTSSNFPLRGEKGSMYEGGLRVPFFISYPGKLPASSSYPGVVSTLDILPTALTACAAPIPEQSEGTNLLELLTASAAPASRTLFWRQGKRAALRMGNWKIVGQQSAGSNFSWELYDITNDLSETENMASPKSNICLKLSEEWQRLNLQMRPALFGQPIAK